MSWLGRLIRRIPVIGPLVGAVVPAPGPDIPHVRLPSEHKWADHERAAKYRDSWCLKCGVWRKLAGASKCPGMWPDEAG